MQQLNNAEKVDMLVIFLEEEHMLQELMIKILILEIFKKEQLLMLLSKDQLLK